MKSRTLIKLGALLVISIQGAMLNTSNAQVHIANYADDFALNTTSSQWEYYWNQPDGWIAGSNTGNLATAAIGDTTSYVSLVSTGTMLTADGDTNGGNSTPDSYLRVFDTGGHPGASGANTNVDRYAIIAYTVTSDGTYAIDDSYITVASQNSNGLRVYIHVNDDTAVFDQVCTTGTNDFDVTLGALEDGDVIYVCVGANGQPNHDSYTLDFDISKQFTNNSGIFYSTLFAKEKPYIRREGHGFGATYSFLKDFNGDGNDDAVAYFSSGDVYVATSNGTDFLTPFQAISYAGNASLVPLMGDVDGDGKQDLCYFDPANGSWKIGLSNGTSFNTPTQWSTGNGTGSAHQFLADVNGDGKDDAVIYFGSGGLNGSWYVGLSTGTGFGSFSSRISSFGEETDLQMMGDVDGDGKADAVYAIASSGDWYVALSDGTNFIDDGVWRSGFGSTADNYLLYDVDQDNKSDIVYINNYDWWVAYSLDDKFQGQHRWVAGLQPEVTKGEIPAPDFLLLGTLDGTEGYACAVTEGTWYCMDNANKFATASMEQIDTWENWGNDYITDLTDVYGGYDTYDAGDTLVIDNQIKMIHDAGFTYITMDITNCVHAWVDDRAKTFIGRLENWNDNLQTGDHKMFFNVALGCTRWSAGEDAFFTKLNEECQRAWDEFYTPYSASYYLLDGKPLVQHMITTGLPYYQNSATWNGGDRTYIDKITNRWMSGEQAGATSSLPNFYGWIIPDKDGNPFHQEMMPIMPGFFNDITYVDREDGAFYKGHWLRVLENNPNSVWLNSFNESWEHTNVEPAYLHRTTTKDHDSIKVWADEVGQRMDDYYWVLTKQYNRLYMNNELYEDSFIKEKSDNNVYKVELSGFTYQGTLPSQAPIVIVPDGFITSFDGTIIDDNQTALKSVKETNETLEIKNDRDGNDRWTLYPNPSKGDFSMIFHKEGDYTYAVIDIKGKVIANGRSYFKQGEIKNIRLNTLKKGIYLIRISSGDDHEIKKLIVN